MKIKEFYMHCLRSAGILALLPSFFSCTDHALYAHLRSSDEVIVHKSNSMKITVPEHCLASGSVQITPDSSVKNFSEWNEVNSREAYTLSQKVIRSWEQRGITDYLIFGKEDHGSSSIFNWEIVPYPQKGWRFWKQFRVLWNITFGGSRQSPIERKTVKDAFSTEEGSSSQADLIKNIAQGNDAFCKQPVIDKQLVFEGKEVHVLYNYAPLSIGKEKLHFLIVPKQHRPKFSDLTETEYLEAMKLSQKLVTFYQKKGYPTAFIFNKTGFEAGQTVPHWHQHVVITATKTQELMGKLGVFKNMIFSSSPLPPKELQTRVQSLRADLSEVL
jgi:diadenosine tetraphosphate (Ap4A) HIT family hydrolase